MPGMTYFHGNHDRNGQRPAGYEQTMSTCAHFLASFTVHPLLKVLLSQKQWERDLY